MLTLVPLLAVLPAVALAANDCPITQSSLPGYRCGATGVLTRLGRPALADAALDTVVATSASDCGQTCWRTLDCMYSQFDANSDPGCTLYKYSGQRLGFQKNNADGLPGFNRYAYRCARRGQCNPAADTKAGIASYTHLSRLRSLARPAANTAKPIQA